MAPVPNAKNNYTLGRGELWFSRFLPNTTTPEGERYIGNSPEWNANIETESLDHFDSDHGVREMDESIPLQTTRTASFITDNISPTNIAYFFFGSVSALAVAAATITAEVLPAVIPGLTYQVGMTDQNPVGARKLAVHTAAIPGSPGTPAKNVILTDAAAATTYEEGVDYEIDMDRGRLYIKTADEGGTIVAGTLPKITYKVSASTRDRIISGNKPIEGSLRYISFNPAGNQFDWYMPWVKLSPNGDYALKGDEWQQIPMSVQILKLANKEALYVDGQPFVA